jgi:hypothetical protein
LLDGAVADQFGQRGAAVAAGDAAFREGADQRCPDEADHQRGEDAGLEACRHDPADHEGGHRNPRRGTRNSRSAWRRHQLLAAKFPRANSPEDGFKILSQVRNNPHEIRANAPKLWARPQIKWPGTRPGHDAS